MATTLVIFGVTGDLSTGKLLPALDDMVSDGFEVSLIGVSRREIDTKELLVNADAANLEGHLHMVTMDLEDHEHYRRLKDQLIAEGSERVLFYLAVPPGIAADIVDRLGEAGLNEPHMSVLFEKPFGFDYGSAKEFIERTGRYFNEEQLYRIDHYMAKEVAQEIIALRSNAENHHHHWSSESIASIDIIASEAIGIEGRAGFYEQTGALRDFVQGHLMQLLLLVLMDIPSDFTIDQLPKHRLAAARHLEPISVGLRAQYQGYDDEVANKGSLTETFAAVSVASSSERWSGVEIRLIAGKQLDQKMTGIVVTYRDGRQDTFSEAKSNQRRSPAYQRVLLAAVNERKELFTTSDEVLRSWELLRPLQEQWQMDGIQPIQYPKGSSVQAVSDLAASDNTTTRGV